MRLIIIPRNGYINRLQAMASAKILALHFHADFKVYWEPEPLWGAKKEYIFAHDYIHQYFIEKHIVSEVLNNSDFSRLPKYLNHNEDLNLVSLVGADQDEQRYLPSLNDLIAKHDYIRNIIIVAGSKFSLLNSLDFDQARKDFYLGVSWHPDITRLTNSEAKNFIGIHVRKTDKSLDAPTKKQMLQYLKSCLKSNKNSLIFVASDNRKSLINWRKQIATLGLDYFDNDVHSFDRKLDQTAQYAIADWLTLSNADFIIFHKDSSYSTEAALMNSSKILSKGLIAPTHIIIIRKIVSGLVIKNLFFYLYSLLIFFIKKFLSIFRNI